MNLLVERELTIFEKRFQKIFNQKVKPIYAFLKVDNNKNVLVCVEINISSFGNFMKKNSFALTIKSTRSVSEIYYHQYFLIILTII